MLRTGVIDNSNAVLRFATAVVVFAFAIAYAAQIGQVAMEAELAEGFGGGLDDFVGVGAALQGIGVVDDGNAAGGFLCAWQVDGFQQTGRTGDLNDVGFEHECVLVCFFRRPETVYR